MPARLQSGLNFAPSILLEPTIRAVQKFSAPARQPVDYRFNLNVHGARGLLALLVFIFHIAASGAPGFSWQTTGLAHAALASLHFSVEIFFCISGYVVVAALRRAEGPGAFLRDRAVRILPVLWATLAVIIPLGLATHQGAFATLSAKDLAWVLPGNLLPLAGALPIPVLQIPAWSLSYELLFYIIAAALWWLPTSQQLTRIVVITVAVALVMWHPRAVFFIVGACVAQTSIAAHPWLRQATRSPGLMFIGFSACWYMVQFGSAAQEGTLVEWAGDGRIGLAAAAIGFSILGFAGLVAGEGWLSALLRTKPLQRLGTLSFSFYLWHVIVIGIAKRVLASTGGAVIGPWSQMVLLVVCLPVCLVIADCSGRFIERNFSKWLKRQAPLQALPA